MLLNLSGKVPTECPEPVGLEIATNCWGTGGKAEKQQTIAICTYPSIRLCDKLVAFGSGLCPLSQQLGFDLWMLPGTRFGAP